MRKVYSILVGRGFRFEHKIFHVVCEEKDIQTICYAHYSYEERKYDKPICVCYCEGETYDENKATCVIDCM